MKALIVEDEEMARQSLARTLTAHFPDIEIVGMTASVRETLQWLRDPSHEVSLIFMDVELSDGDCFEIFRQEKVSADVVMTTAYDSYAVKAFEAGSVDYLMKPIDLKDLTRAVERCRSRQKPAFDLEALLAAVGKGTDAAPKYRERFVVFVGDSVIPVNTADIAFLYSEDKYNHLVTSAGADYIIDGSMEAMSEDLDPRRFFRISRSCIVSMKAIRHITRHFAGRLVLETEPRPPFEMTVSRARVDDFLSWLKS